MPPPGGFFSPLSTFRHRNFSANCMKNHKQSMKFQAEIAKYFTKFVTNVSPSIISYISLEAKVTN
jgi:hypothetical protein